VFKEAPGFPPAPRVRHALPQHRACILRHQALRLPPVSDMHYCNIGEYRGTVQTDERQLDGSWLEEMWTLHPGTTPAP
jgi:hypothetical protein